VTVSAFAVVRQAALGFASGDRSKIDYVLRGKVGSSTFGRQRQREKQPSGRTSTHDEIARTVVWLCDPAAHNLTGTSIPIDGGWTAQ